MELESQRQKAKWVISADVCTAATDKDSSNYASTGLQFVFGLAHVQIGRKKTMTRV